ncbi:MAG: flagellar protein FlaG [Bacterioplanes sp.]|nr:flagellar protein FlaG [Bacterioplanes sp.]
MDNAKAYASDSFARTSNVTSALKAVKETEMSQPSGKSLPPETTEVMSRSDVEDAVSRINDFVQKSQRTLNFQLDEDSGQTVIRVYDKESAELIRQIPGELALELARKLNDEEPSLLFSAQV